MSLVEYTASFAQRTRLCKSHQLTQQFLTFIRSYLCMLHQAGCQAAADHILAVNSPYLHVDAGEHERCCLGASHSSKHAPLTNFLPTFSWCCSGCCKPPLCLTAAIRLVQCPGAGGGWGKQDVHYSWQQCSSEHCQGLESLHIAMLPSVRHDPLYLECWRSQQDTEQL